MDVKGLGSLEKSLELYVQVRQYSITALGHWRTSDTAHLGVLASRLGC